MIKTIAIGHQDFETVRQQEYFYIDKTKLIKEWWKNGDIVTLITRPRRFGKTLNMNMLKCFFSINDKDKGQLFEGLSIWEEEKYRQIQGSFPVISLSFANVKETGFKQAKQRITQLISELYLDYYFLLDSEKLLPPEKKMLEKNMENPDPVIALHQLSRYLFKHYEKKVIILLDEYDTPLQEAYVHGYWKELTEFIRSLFHSTFKTNPYLERALMTGITRVSKESIFSDLNNLVVITTTSDAYGDCFGFTEDEVRDALNAYGLSEHMDTVKDWYDGFIFGRHKDIYNPWSIINYLKTQKLSCYWANTSSNSLVGKLIREGSPQIKESMEDLLNDKTLCMEIDEQMIFNQLDHHENAIWSLLLASGYLKATNYKTAEKSGKDIYELALTNKEVRIMFEKMIREWFGQSAGEYNGFIKALLSGNCKEMNAYMNQIALTTFSYFDSGKKTSAGSQPERFHAVEATTKGLIEPTPSVCFYHGFVLGLVVELADRYSITSNRESGFGRYDVMMEPRKKEDFAIIMEFKVREAEIETSLEDTADEALEQIERQKYGTALETKGIAAEKIRKYGFAFEGKKVLIKSS